MKLRIHFLNFCLLFYVVLQYQLDYPELAELQLLE